MPTLRRAPVMAAVLVAVIAAFSLVNVRPTSASTAGDAIANRALQDLGTYGGQCRAWVQKVVLEAIDVQIGLDYRYGYLDSGFVEVTAAQAQRGDIIQIDNDADTSPSSNFPGLHTFIVLQNLGNGTFNGIDSNQDWDGIVRLHNNFDPAAAAARYAGGTYHIYHYVGSAGSTASTTTTSTAASTPTEPTFKAGDTAVTNTPPPDPYLNLHNAASLAAGLVSVLPNSTKLTITGGPVYADGYWWVPVSSPDGTGWVAAEYLVNTTPAPPPAPAAATTTSVSTSSGASSSYTVAAGDTLYGIAAKFGVSVDALEAANNITNPNVLAVGTTLTIPSGTASSSATASSGSTYSVKAGDTLYSIAAQFGVSVSGLEAANSLSDPNLISVGQQLTIPSESATATTTAAAVAAPVANGSSYTVQPGDTLWGIAGRFGVTVSALQAANNITDGKLILVGDVLKIPSSGGSTAASSVQAQTTAISSSTYTVAPGDTLYGIASQLGIDLASLESANAITNPSLIVVGQALTIP